MNRFLKTTGCAFQEEQRGPQEDQSGVPQKSIPGKTAERVTKALAEKEIDYLKATVVNLEVKQLAES